MSTTLGLSIYHKLWGPHRTHKLCYSIFGNVQIMLTFMVRLVFHLRWPKRSSTMPEECSTYMSGSYDKAFQYFLLVSFNSSHTFVHQDTLYSKIVISTGRTLSWLEVEHLYLIQLLGMRVCTQLIWWYVERAWKSFSWCSIYSSKTYPFVQTLKAQVMSPQNNLWHPKKFEEEKSANDSFWIHSRCFSKLVTFECSAIRFIDMPSAPRSLQLYLFFYDTFWYFHVWLGNYLKARPS